MTRIHLGVVVALVVVLACAATAMSCGPFFPEAIFSSTDRPDPPLERFAGGTLGVVEPTYGDAYLVVAYRHLSGIGLDRDEQSAAVALWNERRRPADFGEPARRQALARWRDARALVSGAPAGAAVDVYRKAAPFTMFVNCPDDAFLTAARTLEDRARVWGAASPDLKAWLAAQDDVFLNCSGGRHIPPALNGAASSLLRADRTYQIAAAHFYAGEFDDAARWFAKVRDDPSSPWRQIAPYLVARSLVRKATVPAEQPDAAMLARADAEIRAILADPGRAPIHGMTSRLRGFVRARLDPDDRAAELGRAVVTAHSGAALKADLDDYTHVLDRVSAARDDLTDWILTFRSGLPNAVNHAIQRWRETQSPAWLAVAVAKMNASHPGAGDVLAGAQRVPEVSPAFPTVAFHVARLTIGAGRVDEARDRLTKLLDGNGSWPPSARNRLVALRFGLARTLDELARDAARVPVDVVVDQQSISAGSSLQRFAPDAVPTLNTGLPLGRLGDLAQSRSLPDHLRVEVALATWTRAVLLDDDTVADRVRPALADLLPELRDELNAYGAAVHRADRRFAAAFALLRTPGAEPYLAAGVSRERPRDIDDFRRNWWCAPVGTKKPAEGPPPGFLSAAERESLARELAKLQAIPTGPNYLATIAIDRSLRNPRDARVPEALHLAVRSTRFGCVDAATSRLSRQAFRILHERFPQSPWATRTPYWF